MPELGQKEANRHESDRVAVQVEPFSATHVFVLSYCYFTSYTDAKGLCDHHKVDYLP